ncbi:hypothetical protein HDR59_00555, partial [bacterium]|nr:hypothetical protein [bacterium]
MLKNIINDLIPNTKNIKIPHKERNFKMSKAILLAKSVVFVDDINILQNQIQAKKPNPFNQISNLILLTDIVGKQGFAIPETTPVHIQDQYVFENIIISNLQFPHKFTIQQNTLDKKSEDVINIAKNCLNKGNLINEVKNIGINFSLYYINNDEKINLKKQLMSNVIQSFDSVTLKLLKNIDVNTKLQLDISDATMNNNGVNKIIYISANFNLSNINFGMFEVDYLNILEKEL